MEPALAKNHAYFQTQRGELVARANGQWVLIHDARVVDIFASEDAAMTEGYRSFGAGPFYVHQISEHEPVVVFASNLLVP